MTRQEVETFVFDLDGTLYEDERVYDRYAQELGRFLPAARRAAFLADWRAAKEGRSAARVGLGYDEAADRLFRFAAGRIVAVVDWDGRAAPLPAGRGDAATEEAGQEPPRREPVVETPIFGEGRFNIGDWWALPDALAAHHGVARDARGAAFHATRAFMSGAGFRLKEEPRLRDLLRALAGGGRRLVVMSNSPVETATDVLERLGLRAYFALVSASAAKPAGLRRFLEQQSDGARLLCIGDNFVNDIEPALRAGSRALYIDRFATGLGADDARCAVVRSIAAALDWLSERYR